MENIKAELIDLSDYVHAGEGANGESLNHKTDPTTMVKLYFDTMPLEPVFREVEAAQNVFEAGIPSPEPGCLVTDGKGRYGIRFKRLVDKVSIARAVANEPEKTEEYARIFAQMCRQLHSTVVDRAKFPDVKQQFLDMLAASPFHTDSEKAKIEALIKGTPDTDTAVHGDLHFGNALIAGGKNYFIDLGEFGVGHPYFDLGMTTIIGNYNDEAFTRESFHMSGESAHKFWQAFAPEYFGEGMTADQAEEMLRPYAVIKSLLIERNTGVKFPFYHELLEKI